MCSETEKKTHILYSWSMAEVRIQIDTIAFMSQEIQVRIVSM